MSVADESSSKRNLLSFVVPVGLLVAVFGGSDALAADRVSDPSTLAGDTVVSIVRIYADAAGESHFEDVEEPLNLVEVAPGIAPLYASPFNQASQYAFLSAEPGWREDWHTAPQRQVLVYLAGVTEFRVSDGEVRRLGPGTILLAEDTMGKGHISEVVGEGDVLAVLIQTDGGQ